MQKNREVGMIKIEIRQETAEMLQQMLLDLPLKTAAIPYNMLMKDIEDSKLSSAKENSDSKKS